VTFLTSPTDNKKLSVFFRKIRPPKYFWGPIARQNPDIKPTENFGQSVLAWVIAVIFVYATLFAAGKFLLLEYHNGVLAGVIAVASGFLLFKVLGLLKKQESRSAGNL
jgi:SSS family solute:Na+ symporter